VNALIPVTNHSYDDYPTFVCSASNDSTIRIWATQTLESVAALKGHRNWIRSLIAVRHVTTASNNVTVKLWSGSDDTTLKIWDLYQPNVKISTLKPKSIQMNCGIFSLAQIDDHIWAGGADKTIKIFDIQTEQVVKIIPGAHSGGVSIIVRIGEFVFTGSMDRSLRTWNKVRNKPLL
jgi:WD40 repeat protein